MDNMSGGDRYWESENEYITKDVLDRLKRGGDDLLKGGSGSQDEVDELAAKVAAVERELLTKSVKSKKQHGRALQSYRVLEYHERGTLQGALNLVLQDLATGAVPVGAVSHIFSDYTNYQGWTIFLVIVDWSVDK